MIFTKDYCTHVWFKFFICWNFLPFSYHFSFLSYRGPKKAWKTRFSTVNDEELKQMPCCLSCQVVSKNTHIMFGLYLFWVEGGPLFFGKSAIFGGPIWYSWFFFTYVVVFVALWRFCNFWGPKKSPSIS